MPQTSERLQDSSPIIDSSMGLLYSQVKTTAEQGSKLLRRRPGETMSSKISGNRK
jgi:hypothetical protein